jgi:hypothetical protein
MEPTFRSQVYKYLDDTVIEMQRLGLHTHAMLLDHLLHTVHWTTADELFEELALSIQKMVDSPSLPTDIRSRLEHWLAGIRVDWPECGRNPREIYPPHTIWPGKTRQSSEDEKI